MEFLKQDLEKIYRWGRLDAPLGKVPPGFKCTLPPIVDGARKIGIEIEVENVRNGVPCDAAFWYPKEDGSLRNHGMEYVTFPIKGNEIRCAVQGFFEVLPPQADFSDRTSIHVHVNARDLQVGHVLNLIMLYLVFERLLYKFAGPHRYQNIFCIPIQDTKLPIAIANFLANGKFNELVREWQKYSGMNLVPLRGLGTVEFRHMEGHRDPVRLMQWINMLLSMFTVARGFEFKDLFNMIQKLNSNSYYEDFMQTVFGRELSDIFRFERLQYLMEPGVAIIKSITLPSPFLLSLVNTMEDNSPLLQHIGVSKKYKVQPATPPEVPKAGNLIVNNMWMGMDDNPMEAMERIRQEQVQVAQRIAARNPFMDNNDIYPDGENG